MTDDDRKKLRELAEWLDRTRTDASYLFSGERGEASKTWRRAITTRTVIALLDEIERLRGLAYEAVGIAERRVETQFHEGDRLKSIRIVLGDAP